MNSSPRAGSSGLFLVCLLPFVALCILNSATYRYGPSDQAFYLPAVLFRLHPELFPRDAPLILSQARLTFADEALSTLMRLTGLSLPPLAAVLYVMSLLLLAAGAWLIAAQLFRSRWAAVVLLAALTLRHQIFRTGTNSLEGYFHPRQLAFGLGALAIAALLRRRLLPAAGLVAFATALHPTTGAWFAIWVAVASVVIEPRARAPVGAAAIAAAAIAVWALTTGPLAGRLIPMDAEWMATLATKDYLFPFEWPISVWAVNLLYVPLIVLLFSRRRGRGLVDPAETGLVVGCLSLLLVFAVALPWTRAGHAIALAVQLQTPRVFWMMDFLATIYVVWAVVEGAGPLSVARLRVATAAVAVAALLRGTYVTFVLFPQRAVVQLDLADDAWGRVMRWARTTDPGSGWLADPMHAVRYGTSVRLAGERDVLVEALKDAAIGMYDRAVAIRTRDRVAAVGDFDSLTAERARGLAAAYGLDYMVTERPIDLPLAFESGRLRVYRLR